MYLLLCVCAQCSMMSPLSSPLCPCGNFLFKFYFFMHKNKWTDIQMKQQVSHIFQCIEWAGFHIHPSDRPSTWVCLCVIFTTFASCRPDLCIIFSHRHFPAKRKTCVSVGRVSFFQFSLISMGIQDENYKDTASDAGGGSRTQMMGIFFGIHLLL